MASCLADTNVLLRSVDPASPLCSVARNAIAGLLKQGDQVHFTAQNLVEFWAVVTRPLEVNGLGWDIERARGEVASVRARFPLLEETPDIFPKWLELVTTYRLAGKGVHDARLVAGMAAHHVVNLLTFDEGHFSPFANVVLVNPTRVADENN